MFAPPPQNARRSVFARLLRVLFVFILTVSNLVIPPASVAQAAPMASLPAQADAPSEMPAPENTTPAPGRDEALVAPPPQTPAFVQLALERLVLTVGEAVSETDEAPLSESALVTVTAVRAVEPAQPFTLTVSLAEGLRTVEGERGVLRWPLPPERAGETLVWQIGVQVDENAAIEQMAVLALEASVQAAGHSAVVSRATLGVRRSSGEVTGAALNVVQQSSRGSVLQQGAVTCWQKATQSALACSWK